MSSILQHVFYLNINPAFTSWGFYAMFSIVLILVVSFYFRRKFKRLEEQRKLLELQVKNRTIEIIRQKQHVEKQKKMLEEEKDKTEKLLLNILPREMADELKEMG